MIPLSLFLLYLTPTFFDLKRALDKTVRVGAANLVIAANALTRHINSLNTLSEQSGCISTFHKGKNRIVEYDQLNGWIEERRGGGLEGRKEGRLQNY